MEINQEMVNEAMAGAISSLRDKIISDLQSSIDWETRQTAVNTVSEFVKEWIQENVIPDVTVLLLSEKAGIVAAITEKINTDIANEIVNGINASLKETMETSYKRSNFFKAIF